MTNKELFKQAIAEAKTIREAALVNAKAALEETLTPHLQSMLASKLEEMAKDEDEMKEEIEEVAAYEEEGKENMDEELNLDEFLAELELEEGSDEEINEAKEEEESEEEEEPTEDEESEEGEEEEEEKSVADLSIEDLKDIIKDIVDSELEAEENETEADEEGEAVHQNDTGNNDDAINLDDMSSPDASDAEINLEELLAELDALDEEDATDGEVYEAKKAKKDDKELDEAIATIETLRNELNEVNLLNAKLLYVNKIFKAKNLSEENKIKVINSFDKATTPNEAKLVFEALNESLDAKESSKSIVKEGIIKGFASKPAGNAPSKQIVETNEQISRFQKLAGITKY